LDQTILGYALCALLGDATKQNHLQSVLKANKKVEFYISQDLKNMGFKGSQ